MPLSYMFEEGRFFLATSSSSRKARNLAARPEVTVTVDDRSTLEWVSATGTAELIRGQRSREINVRLHQPVLDGRGPRDSGATARAERGRDDRYHPRRCSAWDIRSTFFAAVQDAEIPLDDAESWFRL